MHKPLRWQALAHLRGGGGHSQAFELLAGFLTQFSPRTRNNFIAILAALVLVLALMTLPAQAQATVTISGTTSLTEGGLVAQQVGNCPRKEMQGPTKDSNETIAEFYTRYIAWYRANDYNSNYCEFRDVPRLGTHTGMVTVTISNADAGEYIITRDGGKLSMFLAETGSFTNLWRKTFTQGETITLRFGVTSIGNWSPGDTSTNAIVVLPPGSSSLAAAVARHEITIVDDDNTYYIGRRNYHPYDGQIWESQPHCYSPGCAWD